MVKITITVILNDIETSIDKHDFSLISKLEYFLKQSKIKIGNY